MLKTVSDGQRKREVRFMVEIIRTTLNVGLEKPVKVLQIPDTHITESNENDDQRMKDLIEMLRNFFTKD